MRRQIALSPVVALCLFAVVAPVAAQDWFAEGLRAGFGREEVFDAEFYALMNEDVALATDYRYSDLLRHWIHDGLAEGRMSSPHFHVRYYLNSHGDLLKAFGGRPVGGQYKLATQHWLSNGIAEGRRGSPLIAPRWYLENHSDLIKAFGNKNYRSALLHARWNGLQERRHLNPENKTFTDLHFPADALVKKNAVAVGLLSLTGKATLYVGVDVPASSRFVTRKTVPIKVEETTIGQPAKDGARRVELKSVTFGNIKGLYLSDPGGRLVGSNEAPFGVDALKGAAVYPLLFKYKIEKGSISGALDITPVNTRSGEAEYKVKGNLKVSANGVVTVGAPRVLPYPVGGSGWEYKNWERPHEGVKQPGFDNLKGWPEFIHIEAVPTLVGNLAIGRLYLKPADHAVKVEVTLQVDHIITESGKVRRANPRQAQETKLVFRLTNGLKQKDHFEVTGSGIVGAILHEFAKASDKLAKQIEQMASQSITIAIRLGD